MTKIKGEQKMTKSECLYCNATVIECAKVPALDDRDGWQAEAVKHGNDCEWIETRAHKTARIRFVVETRAYAEMESVCDLAEEYHAIIEIGDHMCVENIGDRQYAGVQMLGDLRRACGL